MQVGRTLEGGTVFVHASWERSWEWALCICLAFGILISTHLPAPMQSDAADCLLLLVSGMYTTLLKLLHLYKIERISYSYHSLRWDDL